jgi:hypothetical protein
MSAYQNFTMKELWGRRKFCRHLREDPALTLFEAMSYEARIKELDPFAWRYFVAYLEHGFGLDNSLYLARAAAQIGDDATNYVDIMNGMPHPLPEE